MYVYYVYVYNTSNGKRKQPDWMVNSQFIPAFIKCYFHSRFIISSCCTYKVHKSVSILVVCALLVTGLPTLTHWPWESRIWLVSHALTPHLRFLTLKYTYIFITFLQRLKTVVNISDSWVYLWPICWVWEKLRVYDKLCLQRLWGVQKFNMGRAIEYLWLSWACAKHMARRNFWNRSQHNHSASRRSVASSWIEQQERCPSVSCWFPPFQVSIYALKL